TVTRAAEDEADALVAALRPWLDAAAHAGAAGLAACALLRGGGDADAARVALDRVETDFPDVLRADVARFVRATLAGRELDVERAGGAPSTGSATTAPGTDRSRSSAESRGPGRRAVLVTGAEPSAGDDATARWLRSRGLAVQVTSSWPPVEDAVVDLVVLTPDAPAPAAEALAGAAVPVLAFGRLVSLGVATTSGVLLDRDRLVLTDGPEVVVHRGAGRLAWCEPVSGVRVLARAPEPEPRPVLVEVPAGAPLTTGEPAPAARTTAFLTSDGAARWLLTAAGRSLLDEALTRLLLPTPVPTA
ncbi:hypothetical protein G6556_16555, partial [Cellulomonas sp. IC4_254]|nr:hypothetical protein [Cellulomonas sp. IC4_254]